MFYTPANKRGTRAPSKPSLLIMFMISLVALFAVGCGSSSEDFVVTGNNNNPNPGPGTLTFQFAKAQNTATVPASTVSIQFDYLNASGGIIDTDIVPFNTVITVTPPPGMVSVRITPLDGFGFPIADAVGPQTTPPLGTNQAVDMSGFNFTEVTLDALSVNPDPVSLTAGTQTGGTQQLTLTGTFSNGDVVAFPAGAVADATFTPDNSGTYTVSDTGLVSAVVAGTGSLAVSYTFDGDTVTDTVAVNVTGGVTADTFVVTPDPLSAPIGGTTEPVTATFTPFGGSSVVINNTNIGFSFANAPGFSVSGAGEVSVADSVAAGTSATLTAVWTEPGEGGQTFTDTITVTAANARFFSAPAGNALELPTEGFQYQTRVSSNGAAVELPGGLGYTFEVEDTTVANITSAGVLTTGDTPGTTAVNLLFQGTEVDSFTLTTSNVSITSISVTPESFEFTPGQVADYSVLATFSNGSTADIASSPIVNPYSNTIGSADDTLFFFGRAAGGRNFGNATYTFSVGGNITDTVAVTQAAGYVSDFNVTVGGLASGKIPQNLDGVIDVFATLTNGETIRLLPDQFVVTELTDPNGGFDLIADDNTSFPYNTIIRNRNSSVGDTASYSVAIRGLDYQYGFSYPANETATVNVSTVDSQFGVASVAFTNYADDNILVDDFARPITVLFSNGEVTNFKVADQNVSLSNSASGAFTAPDVYGFPVIEHDDSDDFFNGTITYEIKERYNSPVMATAQQDIRLFDSDDDPFFIPSSIVLNPGETKTVDVAVVAFDANGNVQQLIRTLDCAFPPYQIFQGDTFARTNGSSLSVTAIDSDSTSQVQAWSQNAEDTEQFDTLEVTITDFVSP